MAESNYEDSVPMDDPIFHVTGRVSDAPANLLPGVTNVPKQFLLGGKVYGVSHNYNLTSADFR